MSGAGSAEGHAATDGDIRAASVLRGRHVLRDVARAKVNLTLEICGRRPDGYHELESLVAFTRFGDVLTLEQGRPFGLRVSGPFATAIEGGNLIQRAAALYARKAGDGAVAEASENLTTDASHGIGAFNLDKCIPVAAGLGGGSADAAAALRLMAGLSLDGAEPQRHGAPSAGFTAPPRSDAPLPYADRLKALLPLAASLGADVPVCLFSRPAIMTGIGERIRFLGAFPRLPVVLVNPRQPLSTAAVFRELAAAPLATPAGETPEPAALTSIDAVIDYAASRGNDLEPPARRLLPVIDRMLDALAACPGARLARLSGSGPTCFAVFASEDEAEDAAKALAAAHRGWWVMASVLGD